MELGYISWPLIVSVGALLLGLAFVYGVVQWHIARAEQTPAEKREREIKTRENFGKTEQGRH